MDMSFKEKSAWISLVSTLLIFGYYFYHVFGLTNLPTEEAKSVIAGLALKAIILIIIVESVFHGMLSMTNRKAAERGADERDKSIELQATSYSYWVLTIGVMFCLGRMVILEFNPEFSEHRSFQMPFLTVHILLFSFILSEVIRFAGQIVLYRRGF